MTIIHEIRPEVLAFAWLMEMRLREKDAERGQGWKNKTGQELLTPTISKLFRIEKAIRYPGSHTQDVVKNAIDLGNFCMMIADVAGVLERPSITPDQEAFEIPAFLRKQADQP